MAHTVIWNFDLFCPKFNSMMRGPLQSYAACFAMIAATGFVAFLQNKQTDRQTDTRYQKHYLAGRRPQGEAIV